MNYILILMMLLMGCGDAPVTDAPDGDAGINIDINIGDQGDPLMEEEDPDADEIGKEILS